MATERERREDLGKRFLGEPTPATLAAIDHCIGATAATEKLRAAMAPLVAQADLATTPIAAAFAAQMDPIQTRLGSLGAHADALFANAGASMPSLASLGVNKALVDFASLGAIDEASPLLGNFEPAAANMIRDQYAGLADRIAQTRDDAAPATPFSDLADDLALPTFEADTREIDYLAEMVDLERQRMELDNAREERHLQREKRESRKSSIVVGCGIVGALTSSGALAAILLHL